MSTGFLLVGHAPLAGAFKSVLEDIFGHLEGVEAVDIFSDEPKEKQFKDLEQAWSLISCEQKLILVDVFGATPGNVVCAFAKEKNCECFAPLSLPMIMKLICYREQPLHVLREKAIEASQLSTRSERENC